MTQMTKRHFELVAAAIRTLDLLGFDEEDQRDIAKHFANVLTDEPGFDRAKFMQSCGYY